VRYLVKTAGYPPRQIAVFASRTPLAIAGFSGVAKAFRALGLGDNAVLRLNYQRNTSTSTTPSIS